MNDILLHYLFTGLLLVVVVWLKLHEIGRLLVTILPAARRCEVVLDRIGQTVLGLLAAFLLLDPLFPGAALVEVHVPPEKIVTTRDHLAIRVVPVGLLGAAGGTRTSVVEVDARGVASFVVHLRLLESTLRLDLLDESLPSPVVERRMAYLSPFVRRQVMALRVHY